MKSNEEANKVKTYFRSKFPNIKAETDASLRPNYKVLVGSYFSKQSSSGDLSRVRSYFPEAISVQYKFSVWKQNNFNQIDRNKKNSELIWSFIFNFCKV